MQLENVKQSENTSFLQDWAADGWEVEAPVVKLEANQAIEGELLGEGSILEIQDDRTGEVKPVKTWRISTKAGLVRLMSTYKLDKDLPEKVGMMVRLAHLGQKETRRGQRVNEIVIAARPIGGKAKKK